MLRRTWLHPARRRAFGIYDQLLVELRQMDPSTFQEIPLHGSCLRWNTCKCQRKNLEAAHLVQEAPGRRSQAGGNSSSSCSWYHVLWHAVWVEGVWKHSVWCVYWDVPGHYVTSMQMKLWPRWIEDNLLMDSTGVEISPSVLLLLVASMWQSESLLCLARYIIIYNFYDFVSSEAWYWQ